MIDHFKILREPRRPWLDPDALKSKFHAFSSELHPDRTHNSGELEKHSAQARFTELNSAYLCLSDPKTRLSHLLELERQSKPRIVQEIPETLMERFFEVSGVCRAADEILSKKESVNSPIAKVEWFEKGLEWIERLNRVRELVEDRRAAILSELKRMNAEWEAADSLKGEARRGALPIERAGELFNRLSFASRWSEQLRERIVKLSM